MGDQRKNNENKKIAIKLSFIVFAGLLFGFAIAPLYDVMCKAIGLNGKADTTATAAGKNLKVDTSRSVEVLFTGDAMPGLDWGFAPSESSVTVHPGEIKLTTYTAKNNGSESVIGVAVPSVSPEVASLYFKKIECFCFNQQTLKPGEVKEMPIRFFISPDLPKDIGTVTLTYAFYNASEKVSGASGGNLAKE